MGLLHLKLNILSYEVFGYDFSLFVDCLMSGIMSWIRKAAEYLHRSMIICSGKSRCLALFISFFAEPESSPVSFYISEQMRVDKRQDLPLVTAEGSKSQGQEAALFSRGWGGVAWQAVFIFSLTCLCWRGTRQFLAIDVCGTLERGKGANGVTAWSTAWQASGAYALGPQVYGGRSTFGDWVQ